jgi:hypothetical protein
VSDPDPGAVVYDLDGTLVTLAVDWDAVATDVIAVYEDSGIDATGAGCGRCWRMQTTTVSPRR